MLTVLTDNNNLLYGSFLKIVISIYSLIIVFVRLVICLLNEPNMLCYEVRP